MPIASCGRSVLSSRTKSVEADLLLQAVHAGPQAPFVRRLRLGFFVAFGIIALSAARCCRCIAVTAALVHHPDTMFAQVSMRLRGDPRMCPPRCA